MSEAEARALNSRLSISMSSTIPLGKSTYVSSAVPDRLQVGVVLMSSLTIELLPEQVAQLAALAQARGMSTNQFVQQALLSLLVSKSNDAKSPKRSLCGLLAEDGPAPSSADIDEARREMFGTLGRDSIC